MGLLADFFVATRSDATWYASSEESRDKFEGVEYKNYLPLSISELWAVLDGERLDPDRHDLEAIFIDDDGGSWLFRFPDELCNKISKINHSQIGKLAAEWSESDEVPGDAQDNEPLLRDLIKLCDLAAYKDRSVFLWGSL